jgi:hypothetical protein
MAQLEVVEGRAKLERHRIEQERERRRDAILDSSSTQMYARRLGNFNLCLAYLC